MEVDCLDLFRDVLFVHLLGQLCFECGISDLMGLATILVNSIRRIVHKYSCIRAHARTHTRKERIKEPQNWEIYEIKRFINRK